MIQLACATLSADGFVDTGYEKALEMIPAAGYKYMEYNSFFGTSMLPATIEKVRKRCTETGIQVSGLYCTFLGGAPNRLDVDVAHKLRCMDILEQFGGKRLVFCSTPKDTPGTIDTVIETLKLIIPEAERRNLLLSLENHSGFTIDTVEDYEHIFNAIPSRNLGICIDTGHFDASEVSMDTLIDTLGEKVNHIHVKENRKKGIKDFCRFGEGTTENARIIERMIDRGYEGFITVELSPQQDRETTIEDLVLPYKMFEQYIAEE